MRLKDENFKKSYESLLIISKTLDKIITQLHLGISKNLLPIICKNSNNIAIKETAEKQRMVLKKIENAYNSLLQFDNALELYAFISEENIDWIISDCSPELLKTSRSLIAGMLKGAFIGSLAGPPGTIAGLFGGSLLAAGRIKHFTKESCLILAKQKLLYFIGACLECTVEQTRLAADAFIQLYQIAPLVETLHKTIEKDKEEKKRYEAIIQQGKTTANLLQEQINHINKERKIEKQTREEQDRKINSLIKMQMFLLEAYDQNTNSQISYNQTATS